jgi:hypothetical protein
VIAKRIPGPKGGVGFAQLGAYVLNARAGDDPASWTRLNAYILDADHAGAKVAWSRVTNCQPDDLGWAVKEILATQARNTRSRSDENYHLVVSFPEGEKPTRAQLDSIEDTICTTIGFGEHQRVSAVHQNTDNWHLHIAINKVHPRTFRNIEPWYDHYRLQEICAELEITHGLTRTNHGEEVARGRQRGRAGDFEAHQGGVSFLRWIRDEARPALLNARGRQLAGSAPRTRQSWAGDEAAGRRSCNRPARRTAVACEGKRRGPATIIEITQRRSRSV